MSEKPPTSFRLTSECRKLLRAIGEKLGLKDAAVVELAVRRLASVELAAEAKPRRRRKKHGGAESA